MLIDCDEITQFLSGQILRHSPIAARHEIFGCCKEGLERLKEYIFHNPIAFPDMLLLDTQLEGMNCWDFLEAFRNEFPGLTGHTPAIFLLSDDDDGTISSRAKAWPEVRGTVPKPLTLESLEALRLSCMAGR